MSPINHQNSTAATTTTTTTTALGPRTDILSELHPHQNNNRNRNHNHDHDNNNNSYRRSPLTRLGYEASRSQVVLAGAVAGMVSRFCIAPLDVMKIQLQLHTVPPTGSTTSSALARPSPGLLPTFKSIIHTEGIRGFWKGNVPAEILYITYSASQFAAYHSVTRLFALLPAAHRPPRAAESFIGGAIGGGTATLATYPLDLLRTRFAAQGQGQRRVYASLGGSVREIWRAEGAGGFFRGASAAVMQIMPYMGLFFACYESIHQAIEKVQMSDDEGGKSGGSSMVRRLLMLRRSGSGSGSGGGGGGGGTEDSSTSSHDRASSTTTTTTTTRANTEETAKSSSILSATDAIAGTAAGVAAKTGVFPLDTVRKRLQVQGPTRRGYGHGNIPEYAGVGRTLLQIVRENGARGLYRGLGVSLVKAAPASAVTIWSYETMLKAMM